MLKLENIHRERKWEKKIQNNAWTVSNKQQSSAIVQCTRLMGVMHKGMRNKKKSRVIANFNGDLMAKHAQFTSAMEIARFPTTESRKLANSKPL